ncbi:sodium-dependent glucose transporter 1 isoform X2 [Nerophis ophidion]|uniref:sodium-dependent glucose transporter 1 isoform X2 n=1 Tax=Nerophis ophidion TaxID=159077 RepID=UPI002ADF537B|nr:sodium-dependent glucose transporter 1 isoform X2 [Nerophis ophidion]
MSPSARAKKKQVRFASVMEEDEDTLFEQAGGKRSAEAAGEERAEAVRVRGGGGGGRRGGHVSHGWMVSMTLCASFLGLGMGISVVGPTFEDLAFNVKKNIANISYIFVGRSAGYIGGSVLGGILFDCMNPHLLLGISMLFTACGMCAIPFCKHALLLTGFMSTIGISMGILDTGGLVVSLNTWGRQAQPHIQAQQLGFAVGSFVSPIIAQLRSGPSPVTGCQTGSGPANASGGEIPNSAHNHRSCAFQSTWAYVLIGLFNLLSGLLFFSLYFLGEVSAGKPRRQEKPKMARHHTALIVLLFFFCFASAGAEITFASFIFPFAKKYARMDQSHATGLNSFFWAMFAICQGLSIFLVSHMYPGTAVFISLVGTTLSSLFLCLFSKDAVALWVCTGLYGAFISSIFPSAISWLEQYTTVTGRSAATLMLGAALGELVQPALVGFLFGKVAGHPLLMYFSFLTAFIKSVIFPVMYKLVSAPRGKTRKHRWRNPTDDRRHRQPLLDSEAVADHEDGTDCWMTADIEVKEMADIASLFKRGD